tara:strand:+ start:289 stop:462 length:174 start_codon:yes stop_codon:yes gene_type:complete
MEDYKRNKLNPDQYLKALELGIYEHIKCLSVYEKLVKYYKLCGRTELLIIELNNPTL